MRGTGSGTAGRLRLSVLVVLALGLGGADTLLAQDVGLPVGERPAAVQIEDLDGTAFDMGQVVGRKPVLIQFWATWCPTCEALQPRLEAAKRQYGDQLEVLIVAVAVNQTKRTITRHMERHPLSGRVLWDTQGRATRAYRAPTTGYVVILDAGGRVTYTGVGENQDLVAAVGRAIQ